MFVDNTKKIIVLSVAGTDSLSVEYFLDDQPQCDSVKWMLSRLFTIPSIISENYLTSAISEYDIYGVCRNPIDRVIYNYDNYFAKNNLKCMVQRNLYKSLAPESIDSFQYELRFLKQQIIDEINKDFVATDFARSITYKNPLLKAHFSKQVLWLTSNGQRINKIFKYENRNLMVEELCSRYGIDFSLYQNHETISIAESDTCSDDLSEEAKEKILEYYAEDKALYDSL